MLLLNGLRVKPKSLTRCAHHDRHSWLAVRGRSR